MSREIVWHFAYPQRIDDLLTPPTSDEMRYHVANQPMPYDGENFSIDKNGLLRARERFKNRDSILSLPGNIFDFLFKIVYYGDKIPLELSGALVETLYTIADSLLNAIEGNPSVDWSTATAREYRTITGMIFFLLIQHLKTLVSLLDQNGNEMNKDKKQRVVQKASANVGYAKQQVTTQWGRTFQSKCQSHLDTILSALYLLFASPQCRRQYQHDMLDDNFVQFTLPVLVKLLTSLYTKQIFTHPSLPRTFNNAFLILLQWYCSPEMLEVSTIAQRMKSIVIEGLIDMIKQDAFDHRFLINLIILGFSKYHISYPFAFFFNAVTDLPSSEKTTLSELPKALKLLGTKLPARSFHEVDSLVNTLTDSQSYSIRNSIVELIASLITNAFVLPPDYHPGVSPENEVIYYRPLEHSQLTKRPVGAVPVRGDENDDEGDENEDEMDDKKAKKFSKKAKNGQNGPDSLDMDDFDNGDGDNDENDDEMFDDDDDMENDLSNRTSKMSKIPPNGQNSLNSVENGRSKRRQRYSIAFDEDLEVQLPESDSKDPNGDGNDEYDVTTLLSVNQLGHAAERRASLIQVIVNRLADINTEARTRAIQCLGSVLLTTPIPIDFQLRCMSAVYHCLHDKSAKVRKYSLMFFRSMIQRNVHPGYRYSLTHDLNSQALEEQKVALMGLCEELKGILNGIKSEIDKNILYEEKLRAEIIAKHLQNNPNKASNAVAAGNKKTNKKIKAEKVRNGANDENPDQNENENNNPNNTLDGLSSPDDTDYEAILGSNQQYAALKIRLVQLQSQFDKNGKKLLMARLDLKACRGEIIFIMQIQTLLTDRCVPLLKSSTVTDVEEAISCILTASAAHLQGVDNNMNYLLSQCTNATITNHVAETWGALLLDQFEQHTQRGGNNTIFFDMMRLILSLRQGAKEGLARVFESMLFLSNGLQTPSSTSLHAIFSSFLRDTTATTGSNGESSIMTTPIAKRVRGEEDKNAKNSKNEKNFQNAKGDKNEITYIENSVLRPLDPSNDFFKCLAANSNTDTRALTVQQAQQVRSNYNNMLGGLLFEALDYLYLNISQQNLPLIDTTALLTLIKSLIGTTMPVGTRLYSVIRSILVSPHGHPLVKVELLQLLSKALMVLKQEDMTELTTFCVNSVIYGLQIIAVPLADSIIQYSHTCLVDPNELPDGLVKKRQNANQKGSKDEKGPKKSQKASKSSKKRSKSSRDEDDVEDDDFDGDDEQDGQDERDNGGLEQYGEIVDGLLKAEIKKTSIIDSKMLLESMQTQAKQTLYWTQLADVAIRMIAKVTKNAVPVYEHILRHMSLVLTEIDETTHYNYILQHGPAYIPSLCSILSTIAVDEQAFGQGGGNDHSKSVTLNIPQQCHCDSVILLKAQNSVTLPQNCSLFDPKLKLAIAPISQQERLTRLFTVTGFITMQISLIIEESESKIRALTKKEVESNLYSISLSNQFQSPSTSGGNRQMSESDQDSDDDDITPSGPTKRKAPNTVRNKAKKSRSSVNSQMDSEEDGDINGESDGEAPQGLLKRGQKRQVAKKSSKRTQKASSNNIEQEDEEERAGMISRAEQHIDDNVKFIERSLINPNHCLGMIYKLINHVCRARNQFQPSVFYAALGARCKLMLISKDVCSDAIPGLISLLTDFNTTQRSLDPDYVITVKQLIATAIADGAQRFPNECAVALDHLNILATDRNEQVSIYALHALASVLLTGMHKPNRALPHICTCLASEHQRIVSVARALVRTLGSKRDGNISLIATAFPDIVSRFLESITANAKSSAEKPLKVAKELLRYVKTEQEIGKVVNGITTRLGAQLKLNNIESSSSSASSGVGVVKFDANGQPIIETSTKMLLKKLNNLSNRFDRYRFTQGWYTLTGTKKTHKKGTSRVVQSQLHSIRFPAVVHLDLKADVVGTKLVPATVTEYCSCGLINCECVPIFKIKFDFITGDEHNLLQLDQIEQIEDLYNIKETSDNAKLIAMRTGAGKGEKNTGPTAQDYFSRAKFLLIVLQTVKFNISTARRFVNDFNEYSQACQHPQLYHELQNLGKHIRQCVLRLPGRVSAAAQQDGAATTNRSTIEQDIIDWERRIEKEYERFNKANAGGDGNGQGDDDDDDDDGQNVPKIKLSMADDDVNGANAADDGRNRRSQRRQQQDKERENDEDENDDRVNIKQEEGPQTLTRRGGRRAAAPVPVLNTKKAPVVAKKKEKGPVGKRNGAKGRKKGSSEEEESSSESSESSSSSTEEEKEEEEEKPMTRRRPAPKRR